MQTIQLASSDDWTTADTERHVHPLREALDIEGLSWHHIGSTSIPGILCKPVLDLLCGVPSTMTLDMLTPYHDALEEMGYEIMGEFGIPGRRYFRKFDAQGRRLVHIHAFLEDDPNFHRHVAFRDYLRAHPEQARAYSKLKATLVERHHGDAEAYIQGKHDFIVETEARAIAWAAARAVTKPSSEYDPSAPDR